MNQLNFLYLHFFWLFAFFAGVYAPAFGQGAVKQGNPVPVNFSIKEPEMKLFRMVNEYRQQYGLPAIPLSKSLCYVAAVHAKDLMFYHPDQGSCNFHSWSNKGSWIPVCYPKDETKKVSVWDKPRELTTYPAKAYEIVYWENTQLLPDSIMMVWRTEDYFNSFLLNTGKWQGQTWNAIGIAIFENYACAWFGMVTDPEGTETLSGTKPDVTKSIIKDSTTRKSKKPLKETKTIQVPKPVTDYALTTQPVNSWFIIIKTNLPADAAQKLVEELRSKDYPQAKFFEKDGKTRVSVFGPVDKPTASAMLKEVKKVYKDAWLLKE